MRNKILFNNYNPWNSFFNKQGLSDIETNCTIQINDYSNTKYKEIVIES